MLTADHGSALEEEPALKGASTTVSTSEAEEVPEMQAPTAMHVSQEASAIQEETSLEVSTASGVKLEPMVRNVESPTNMEMKQLATEPEAPEALIEPTLVDTEVKPSANPCIPINSSECPRSIHSTGPGLIQCPCVGTDIIPKPKSSIPHRVPTPPPPATSPQVSALLAQLQSLLAREAVISGAEVPKVGISYICDDAEGDEEEEVEVIVRYKARRTVGGKHRICAQARGLLGTAGDCGFRC